MKLFPLILLTLLPVLAQADEPMIKIVYQEANAAPDSFEAQPKTLYRWGDKSRLEAPYDPVLKVRALSISDGKNLWIINQDDHTGGHLTMPDQHGFYPLILPVSDPGPQRAIDFAFGRELAYMTAHQAKLTSVTSKGITATFYETVQEGLRLKVFLEPGTKTPLGVSVSEGDHCLAQLYYQEYTSLKPDPKLFQVPAGVKISEVPQQ